jgi:hypothetical protein
LNQFAEKEPGLLKCSFANFLTRLVLIRSRPIHHFMTSTTNSQLSSAVNSGGLPPCPLRDALSPFPTTRTIMRTRSGPWVLPAYRASSQTRFVWRELCR